MSSVNNLFGRGLTNQGCAEDYGRLASATKPSGPIEYVHYCTSNKCTHYEKQVITPKGKSVMRTFFHAKVHKFTSTKQTRNCPDCGSSLVIK